MHRDYFTSDLGRINCHVIDNVDAAYKCHTIACVPENFTL